MFFVIAGIKIIRKKNIEKEKKWDIKRYFNTIEIVICGKKVNKKLFINVICYLWDSVRIKEARSEKCFKCVGGVLIINYKGCTLGVLRNIRRQIKT